MGTPKIKVWSASDKKRVYLNHKDLEKSGTKLWLELEGDSQRMIYKIKAYERSPFWSKEHTYNWLSVNFTPDFFREAKSALLS